MKVNLLLGVVILCLSTTPLARDYNGWQPSKGWSKSSYGQTALSTCPSYCHYIDMASDKHQVPKNLIISIIKAESNFNPNAVSPKGAKGLMQLMDINSQAIDPFNPSENIDGGTELLARLIRQYEDIELALAAYNAGQGNVAKYGGVPPFKETKQYIAKVMVNYRHLNEITPHIKE